MTSDSERVFNPHGNRTADGVLITVGLVVWTNEMEVGIVRSDDDASAYGCCLGSHGDADPCPKSCRHDHWFTVDTRRGSKSFNGELLAIRFEGKDPVKPQGEHATIHAVRTKSSHSPRLGRLLRWRH
jgi:hypothetical protein